MWSRALAGLREAVPGGIALKSAVAPLGAVWILASDTQITVSGS